MFSMRAAAERNFARVWPGREHALLRPPQFRRRNELHRARNLLRVLHRTNAPPIIE
jgi:hypothetical protein